MRTIVTFADGRKLDQEFPDTDPIGVNDLGMVVISKNKIVLGTFMSHALAGVYHPDGPDTVTLATPGAISLR